MKSNPRALDPNHQRGGRDDARLARTALDVADGIPPVALVMLKTGRTLEEAKDALDAARGAIFEAVKTLQT